MATVSVDGGDLSQFIGLTQAYVTKSAEALTKANRAGQVASVKSASTSVELQTGLAQAADSLVANKLITPAERPLVLEKLANHATALTTVTNLAKRLGERTENTPPPVLGQPVATKSAGVATSDAPRVAPVRASDQDFLDRVLHG